jgi:Na+-driven multidrug efflux pump
LGVHGVAYAVLVTYVLMAVIARIRLRRAMPDQVRDEQLTSSVPDGRPRSILGSLGLATGSRKQ